MTRMTRLAMVGGAAAALAGLLGVAELRPVRLAAGASDTIVINTTRPLWLNVNVVSLTNRLRPQSGVHYSFDGGDRLDISDDGHIACRERKDSRVRVAAGSMVARVTVLCRPIAAVLYSPGARLVTHAAPRQLPLVAVGFDTLPVPLSAPRTKLGSDSIAHLDGWTLTPRAPGVTWIDVSLGECVHTVEVAVDDSVSNAAQLDRPYTVYATQLSAIDDSLRAWRLGPGRYELWARDDSAYRFDAGSAKCVRARGPGQRFECVAAESVTLAVRRIQGRSPTDAKTALSIRRLADSVTARRAAIARIARRLESRTVECKEVDSGG